MDRGRRSVRQLADLALHANDPEIRGAAAIYLAWRRRKKPMPTDLSPAETERLGKLLDDVNV